MVWRSWRGKTGSGVVGGRERFLVQDRYPLLQTLACAGSRPSPTGAVRGKPGPTLLVRTRNDTQDCRTPDSGGGMARTSRWQPCDISRLLPACSCLAWSAMSRKQEGFWGSWRVRLGVSEVRRSRGRGDAIEDCHFGPPPRGDPRGLEVLREGLASQRAAVISQGEAFREEEG